VSADASGPFRAFTVIVREVVEHRITVDPDQSQWSWLGPEDDWLSDLDTVAGETEGPVEIAVRADPTSTVIGAWREVIEDDDPPAASVRPESP